MSIDLHIHTTASDGDVHPVTVVKLAAQAGLKVISITDHESTSGFYPASAESHAHGITVIPAVELLTIYKNKEIHVLGYFIDPDNKYLQEALAELRRQRTMCAKECVKRLREFGFNISWSDVEKLAQPDGPVSKGHIVQAVNNAGYIKERKDAIEFLVKYLNREGLAYICHDFHVDNGIRLIRECGGIPVLAHPGLIRDDNIVEELCCNGIAGIEVFYYYFGQHRDEFVRKYNAVAENKNLLKTGGSDYHGTVTPVVLGENHVPFEEVKDFLSLFGITHKI